MQLDAGHSMTRTRAAHPALSHALNWFALAALFGVAIVVRHLVAANTDISWLLTAGERVLDGQRLYVDVIETNPPMAVLAYMPGIVIARALHVPPEIVTDALVFFGIAISLLLSAKILQRSSALDHVRGWPLALITFAALAILPTQAFGQREHLALIALMPALAVYVMRATNEAVPRWAVIVAGLGAGLTLTFKPQFGIAILFALTALALRARASFLRIFFAPENFIAASVVIVYVAGIALFAPEFFTVIGPLLRDVYMPVGISWTSLLTKDAVPIWLALIAAAAFLKRKSFDAPLVMLLAASTGFALVFLLQRKGFSYHSYPMLALAVLALGYAIAANMDATKLGRALNGGAAVLLAMLFAASMLWFDDVFDAKPLQARVEKLGAHPKILALTAEPGIGHPLVRALNGTWVSRQQALWVSAYAKRLRSEGMLDPPQDATLTRHEARERAMLVEDIKKNPPDIVLVDNLTGDGSTWLRDPDLAVLLKSYRLAETLNRVDILKRAE